MKLIIDIDENVFTRLFDNGIQDNEISVDDICEMARALRLGKPLKEELEKILTEAFSKSCYLEVDNKRSTYIQLCLLNGIIYNHISKLKGDKE